MTAFNIFTIALLMLGIFFISIVFMINAPTASSAHTESSLRGPTKEKIIPKSEGINTGSIHREPATSRVLEGIASSTASNVGSSTSSNASSTSNLYASFPPILYGTAWKKDRTKELVELAVQTGFRAIDTACQPKHYSEPGVGEAVAAVIEKGIVTRSDLFIQTKFTPVGGQDPNNVPYNKSSSLAAQVAESFQVSLNNLGTGYLDGLLLHSPLPALEDTLTVWKAFEYIYKTGQVRNIGLSNTYSLDTLRSVYEAASVKPTILQNRFFAKSGYDVKIREYCEEKGIKYESFWTLTANRKAIGSKTVTAIASKYHKTKEQIFFRFVRSLGITPLSGTKSKEHMQQDLEIDDIPLTEEELLSIKSLLWK